MGAAGGGGLGKGPDLTGLHLGRREDGEPWRLALLGRHVLVAGATGAGKSSVVASLTAYIGDKALKERAKQALGRLLTKGRAVGVSVVGCVQDPRKDILEVRNLFTTRIGLRLAEKTEVPMVLGEGARDRGALCDRIPMTAPGVGYLVEDGSTVVTKVRAAYIDDDQLRWLAETYPSPTREVLPEVVDVEKPKRPRKRSGGSDREAS